MAERTENSRINTYINTAGAVPALKELGNEFKKLQSEQKKLAQGSDDWKKVQKDLEATSKKMVDYTKTVDKTKMTTKQLSDYSRQLKKMREDLVPGTQAWKALDKEISSTSKAMRGAGEGTGLFSKGMSALGNVIKVNPLLMLAGVLMAIVAAFKQNDAVMKVFERATKAIGTVVALFVDKIVLMGSKLISAFSSPKQAMKDLYEFVKTNLINRFTAFGVILDGIINLDFEKIANGVLQAGSGVEDVIGKVGEMGKEFADAAKKQDEITLSMQKLRDEERKLSVLNTQRAGEIDLLMAKSMDLNLSVQERQKNLEQAEKLEQQMASDTIKHAEKKLSLIKAENALSVSNEEARQKESDAEKEVMELKAANELKLQQIKNKGSKLDKKENKEAEAAEALKQQAIQDRIDLEKEFKETIAKIREDERTRNFTAQEKELDDIELKYAKIKALAKQAGQETTEINDLYLREKEAAEKKHQNTKDDIAKEAIKNNQNRLKEEISKNELSKMGDLERERHLLEVHYTELLSLDGITAEQRLALEAAHNAAKDELDAQYFQNKIEKTKEFFDLSFTVLNDFADISNNLAQRELQKDKKVNDEKKKNLEKRLQAGQISQEQYNAELEKLDAQYNAKKSAAAKAAYQKAQALRIAEAIANTALAVTAAIAANPVPPFPSAIAAGVLGAMQVAKIVTQAPPEFGEGGIIDGPSHAQGGMPVINPNTGEVAAIIEGKEGIVRTSSTAANSDVINWMNANPGKRITPDVLMGASMPRFNFASASEATMLEKGGFLNNPGIRKQETMQMAASGETQSFAEMLSELRGIRTSVDNLELVISTEDLAIKLKDQERLKSANRLK
jgi:hypothetical protein